MIRRLIDRQESRTLEARHRIVLSDVLPELERILDGRLHVRVNAGLVRCYALMDLYSHAGDYLALLQIAEET